MENKHLNLKIHMITIASYWNLTTTSLSIYYMYKNFISRNTCSYYKFMI